MMHFNTTGQAELAVFVRAHGIVSFEVLEAR